MVVSQQKREMRTKILSISRSLPKEEMEQMSQKVFGQLEQMEEFKSAKTIAFFWSMPDEIPTHSVVKKWAETKQIALPVTEDGKMFFRLYDPKEQMQKAELNYLEPKEGRVVEPSEIELVIVPGVAFDKEGGRLGRGRAYYDSFLDSTPAPKVAVGMSHQKVDSVPREPHDRLMDIVVLPEGRLK